MSDREYRSPVKRTGDDTPSLQGLRHGGRLPTPAVLRRNRKDQDDSIEPTQGQFSDQKRSQAVSDLMSPDDIIIAVMGMTGSGKTTFISHCIGEDVGIGHGLHSYTQDVAVHSFMHRGRIVRLIDTPGFDDTSKADVTILNNIAFWLSHAYRATPKLLLSGIIYLHPIHEPRLAGSAMKNLEMMKLLCGREALPAVLLATTMWDHVSSEIGLRRQQELTSSERFWGDLIRQGSSFTRHDNSDTSAFRIVDRFVNRGHRICLTIQRQMVDEHRLVGQTDAGRCLNRTVLNEQDKVRDRLARSAQELEEILAAQEAAQVEELLQRQYEYQEKLDEKSQSLAAMKINMQELRDQKAKEFREREQQFAREKQEQQQKMDELEQQLRDLQCERQAAVKRAQETTNQGVIEDDNFMRLLQKNQAAIAELDQAIATRKQDEERVYRESQQTQKKESIFKHTMKTTAADMLVHGIFHVGKEILSAACILM